MNTSRLGKRDIFSRPTPEAEGQKKRPEDVVQEPKVEVKPQPQECKGVESPIHPARGRPKEHMEGWTKVTVILLDRQIHWLDKLAADIRLNTKCAVSRAEILRAMVSAAEESGLDLSQARSDGELREILKNKLR